MVLTLKSSPRIVAEGPHTTSSYEIYSFSYGDYLSNDLGTVRTYYFVIWTYESIVGADIPAMTSRFRCLKTSTEEMFSYGFATIS